MATADPHERSGSERRRQPRGGRRAADIPGLTPLVLVVGSAAPARDASEAVLAKLRFGVATANTTADAVKLIGDLRPEVVVVPQEDILEIRTAAPDQLRVVVMRDDPDLLVDAIRRSLA